MIFYSKPAPATIYWFLFGKRPILSFSERPLYAKYPIEWLKICLRVEIK